MAIQFVSALQCLAYLLSNTFPSVDSSVISLAAGCLLFTCLPQQNLAASSAIKVQTKWCDFIVDNVLHYILSNYLRRLREPHCIRQSSGQKVANSALGSTSLATPALQCKKMQVHQRAGGWRGHCPPDLSTGCHFTTKS